MMLFWQVLQMNKFIYWGPKEKFLKRYDLDKYYTFSELVKIVQKEEKTFELKGVETKTSENIGKIENLIIFSDEYSMVNEWVLSNLEAFLSRFDIDNVYIQNPPNNVYERISKNKECIEDKYKYLKINIKAVKEMNKEFSKNIIGQNDAKIKLINLLYSATFEFFDNKPLILMFYGPSGVGKTETAKFISSKIGGNIFRKQFSMFQNNEFANYLFGNKHTETSFAKDLLDRETNVILLDEFDKANSLFFSAFYQLFDEGIFIDKNYSVELKNSIIICTSNYETIEEIKENLGIPIYNRFDGFVHFEKFDEKACTQIIEKNYEKYLSYLSDEQKKILEEKDIKKLLLNNSKEFSNAREIDRIVRDVIVSILANKELNESE